MSNRNGCKGEAIILMQHYLIDIIYKTFICKITTSRKNTNHTKYNNLMFQVIFIFFDWILINQIIVLSTPFVLEKTDFQKILPEVLNFEWGTEVWVKIYSTHFLRVWTPYIEKDFPYMVEYTSYRKFNQHSGER